MLYTPGKLPERDYKWTNAQREDATVRKRRSGETYRLGGFDEDLGAAELELILVHVDRP